MSIETILGQEKINEVEEKPYSLTGKNNKILPNTKLKYAIFSQQYLEAPIISGDSELAISPTICTIKKIPVIDDW